MEKENIKNTTTLPFIKTSDKETMEKLVELNFNLVDYNNGIWTFLNCSDKANKINFKSDKYIFSNKLFI